MASRLSSQTVKNGEQRGAWNDSKKTTMNPLYSNKANLHSGIMSFTTCILRWIEGLKKKRVVQTVQQLQQQLDQCQPTTSQLREVNEWFWGIKDGETHFNALEVAAEGDDNAINLAVLLAADDRRLSKCDSEKRTVMHFAVIKCGAETVRNIVTKGGDSALPDIYGDTPLHLAAQIGNHDVIQAMCSPLTKEDMRHSYFPVLYRRLPAAGLASKMNHRGWTALHMAAEYGHTDALVALVKYAEADIDCRRLGDGYTAAHIAVELKNMEMLITCLELGSDSEVRNYRGETPQQMAFLMGRQDIVEFCQQYGAAPRQLDYAETEQIERAALDDDDEGPMVTQATS